MQALLQDLERTVGAQGFFAGQAAAEQARSLWGRLGEPLAVVRPRSTEEVSQVLRAAHASGAQHQDRRDHRAPT